MRVARNREPGVTLGQVAADIGVPPISLTKWLRQANTKISTGTRLAATSTEWAGLHEARKRIRTLE